MKFEGKHTVSGHPQELWDLLNDVDFLRQVTPGLKTLESIGPDEYDAYYEIKIGPVSGNFSGQTAMVDKHPPERYTLKSSVKGRIGTVASEFLISLTPCESGTEVAFSGEARLTGVMATMGQRVLSGVAKSYTKQFFTTLEAELGNRRSGH